MATKDLTLYHIEENLQALLDTVDMTEGDARLEILDEIAAATEAAIQKRDNVIRFLRHVEMQIDCIDREIKRLQELKKSYQAGYERVSNYVVGLVQKFGAGDGERKAKRLEGTIGVLTVRRKPASVVILDEDQIPLAYKRIPEPKPVPNKDAIKKALESGEVVPGADLRIDEYGLVIK